MLGIVSILLIISVIVLCVFIGLYISCKKSKDSYSPDPTTTGTMAQYLDCPMCGVCQGVRSETYPDRCLKKMLYRQGLETEYNSIGANY